ncbi:MAG: NAD(P)H-hydrate dehydratase [Phycisphaeraceae bacterium]|nr:NAD(P)H-hydrate dehydratase [Phycisphaeraceae bacterium]
MLGAPALVALAAFRAGAGLVRIAAPAPILNSILTICPSATGQAIPTDADGWYEPHAASMTIDRLTDQSDVLVVGTGLGQTPGACAATLRAIQQERSPVVLDADAINCLGSIPDFFRDFHASAVLTPHPGEFRRLCSAMGLRGDLGLADSRANAAEQMAQRLGRVVVLKGHDSVVTDGQRTHINTTGHPCLATAGSGDVLCGVIAAFIAQFVDVRTRLGQTGTNQSPMVLTRSADRPFDLFQATCAAVHVHGLAAELWSGRERADTGMTATDLCNLIPVAVESLRKPSRYCPA